jgi:predicted PurR-regulated permease PerM
MSAATTPAEDRSALPTYRQILRTVLTVLCVVIAVYLLIRLRKPIGWIVLGGFLALAMSGPVNLLSRYMRRGLAIALSYLGLILVPVGIGLVLVPPVVRSASDLASEAPQYATDARNYLEKNKTFRKLQDDYQIGTKLQKQADKLPEKIGGAASTLASIGIGLVNSIFAGITILIMSIFMVASGPRWQRALVDSQPPGRAQLLERTLGRIRDAIGNYVAGALLQATIAGVTTFIVLTILGVPFAAPLAVITGVADLIPLVGATLGALLVGVVTVFADFPIDTIIWTIWAIAYQQFENTVIQPRIQSRAVDVHPFIVLVSVLFGSTLFGIPGALLAIPAAASIQIAARELWAYRAELRAEELLDPDQPQRRS